VGHHYPRPYGEANDFNLPISFEDSGPAVPIFLLLRELRQLGDHAQLAAC
jgi:hypothetical protein